MNQPVDFDHYTDDYNRLLKEKTQFFSSSEVYFAQYKVDIVRARVAQGVKRVLEFGCGIGRNIPFLQQAFPNAAIVGSDISQASLDTARTDNPDVQFIHDDGTATDMGQFDVIFVAGVFHHIPPALRDMVTANIRQRLAPGGTLFVFEHNPYNPVTRRIVSTCPYDADAVLLKPGELTGRLRKAGLAIERKQYCLFIPPSLPALLPLERKLGWLPLGGQYWVQARHAR
ncbi:MAG: class I SAM-dependent methyltransferase [Gammaproteobacteria bacterium]